MRLGLPSTPISWAFSSQTHRFENALESGSKRKNEEARLGGSRLPLYDCKLFRAIYLCFELRRCSMLSIEFQLYRRETKHIVIWVDLNWVEFDCWVKRRTFNVRLSLTAIRLFRFSYLLTWAIGNLSTALEKCLKRLNTSEAGHFESKSEN